MIKIASCKKSSAVRSWVHLTTFPIPAKNAKKKFKGLPECLGGDPPAEKIEVTLTPEPEPDAICEGKDSESAPMEQ